LQTGSLQAYYTIAKYTLTTISAKITIVYSALCVCIWPWVRVGFMAYPAYVVNLAMALSTTLQESLHRHVVALLNIGDDLPIK
jgi:hypothetical protein